LDKKKISDWVQTMGFFAVFASLLFVGYEIRQSGQAAREDSLLNEHATIVAMAAIVAENADVWRRGCEGENLDPTEHLIFTQIFYTYVWQHFLQWVRTREGISTASAALAVDIMAINLHRNSGLRREWQLQTNWRSYVPDDAVFHVWRRLVENRLSAFATIEPVPISNTSRCGLR